MHDFDVVITELMKRWRVPGCAVAIVQGKDQLLAKGYGKLRLTDARKVDERTLFPIASLTKPFTAAAIGWLVEHGYMHWDDPIIKHYPQFRLSDPYATQHLTLRDSLAMRSGFDKTSDDRPIALEDLSTLPLIHGFRGRFAYQNLLYLLVGKVIELNQKTSWGEFVQATFFDPLGMSRTYSRFANLEADDNRAYGHHHLGREVAYENLDSVAPAAGLISCASDMARWLTALLGNNPQIVSRRVLDTLLSPQVVASPDGFLGKDLAVAQTYFPNYRFLTYGCGWFIHDYAGVKVCQAPGLTDGMMPVMAVIPELDLGITILDNIEAPFFAQGLLFALIDATL